MYIIHSRQLILRKMDSWWLLQTTLLLFLKDVQQKLCICCPCRMLLHSRTIGTSNGLYSDPHMNYQFNACLNRDRTNGLIFFAL
ncbi:hypothetical protein KC19_10G178700 [Ceratodon purpureus]|uniref:Uncharacterized protein n=1 Tax=Ceratodon purpureus TaxID=3225 RepID=A0A8T0GN87_CERPU|nr:hypothetical protein KC19_10G178700 [Ceratodon purpureus]